MGLLGEFLYFLRKSLESCVHAEIFKDVHTGNAQEQLTFLRKSEQSLRNLGFVKEIVGILTESLAFLMKSLESSSKCTRLQEVIGNLTEIWYC